MILDRLLCGLSGHRSALKQFGEGRMWLACPCGWRSSGWQIGKTPPQRVIPFLNLRHVRDTRRKIA